MAQWVEVHRLAVGGGEAGIARDVGDRIGRVWLSTSRFADVSRLAELTLSLGEDAGSFYDLGRAKRATGSPREALAAYDEALRLYQAADHRGNEAATLSNIGHVYAELGEPRRALGFYERALPILWEVGNRRNEASTLSNSGRAYDRLGERGRALEFYDRGIADAPGGRGPGR